MDVRASERREGRVLEAWLETMSEPLFRPVSLFMVAFTVAVPRGSGVVRRGRRRTAHHKRRRRQDW